MPTLLTIALLLLLTTPCLAAPAMLARDWGGPLLLRQTTVVAPPGPARDALLTALRQAGADVQVIAPEAATEQSALTFKPGLLDRTLILLGGLHSNRALMPLYARYLSFGDAAYPGGDGYTIRTVAAPFGPGTAALALEASSPAGEQAAVARLGELLAAAKDGALPATVEAHLPPETLKRVGAAAYPSLRWALTGDAQTARQAAENLLGAIRGELGYAPYGDYGIERWAREIAWLQDAPGVTPGEVQRLDQALLQTSLATQTQYWRRRDGRSIGGRHETMGTSSIAAVVEPLVRRGVANDEAAPLLATWWDECQAYWRNAASTFHDDLEGWPSYCCPEPTLDWAMALGVGEYVSRQLPLAILRSCAVTDPMGYYAGTGTYEECRPGDVYKPLNWGYPLQVANAFHPGAGYDWLLANFSGLQLSTWAVTRNHVGAHSFAVPGRAVRPDHLLGLTTVPLGEYRHKQLVHDRDTALAQKARYLAAPLERCFEKLSCRDGFTTDSQYLCLEGFQTSFADNLPPMDANSIIRYTDLGHVWLCANTEKQGNLPRSAVFCTDGRNDTPSPAGCELQAVHNGPQVGLSASRLSDYTACDWTRNLIWRRGKYFVVVDLLQQTRAGVFGLTCTFRTPQRAWLQPDGMLMREAGATMRIRNADGVALSLEGGDELEGASVPTLLRETRRLDGQPGEVRVFRNLLFASDPSRPADLQVRPLGESALLVRGTCRGTDELALVAATLPGKPLTVPGLSTDAQILYLGADCWAQAGGTRTTVGGATLSGAEGSSPAPLTAFLEKLWSQAKPATTDGAHTLPTGQGSARVLWQADAFTALPEAVPAPVLRAQPAGEGLANTLFDRVVTRWPTVRWAPGAPVELKLDLAEQVPLVQIDIRAGALGDFNTIPDPSSYPAARVIRAEFSNDGFAGDTRTRDLTFTSDCTFEGLHKGSVFPILRWTCRGLNESARHVRLTLSPDQWPQGVAMCELSLRQAGPSAVRTLGMLQRDVAGDGRREVITWSDQAELVVLREDGSQRLRKQFPGHITAVECFSGLAADGPRLLVTTREARLYCLKPDGAEAWKVDFLASARQNTDLPTGYSIGLLHRPDGRPLIVVGNYNLASFVEPEGRLAGDCRLPAAYQTMTLPYGFDFDGDGFEETISTEVWGVLSVLDTNLKRKGGTGLPRGKGLMLTYYQPPTPEQVRVFVCTETGLGMLDARTLKYEWLHGVSPISDCTLGDLNGDGRPEIVVAKQDGYLQLYDGAGTLLHSRLISEPVRAVAVVQSPDGPVIAVVLPGRLVSFPADLSAPRLLAQGDYSRIMAADAPGTLFAAGEGGVLSAFVCQD